MRHVIIESKDLIQFKQSLIDERTILNKRLVVCPNCMGNGMDYHYGKCRYCNGHRVVLKRETIEYYPIDTEVFYDQFSMTGDGEFIEF